MTLIPPVFQRGSTSTLLLLLVAHTPPKTQGNQENKTLDGL